MSGQGQLMDDGRLLNQWGAYPLPLPETSILQIYGQATIEYQGFKKKSLVDRGISGHARLGIDVDSHAMYKNALT
ncbi:hypothetical protein RRG08_014041 [Elysia crispata]|uniref:Uncharacterized protein n=1 Tax=Elysia crispata TaxID=231223 RepID=A0AAE0ZZE1_9GAST|nr:hypothetical protein RRG08_014041 [Elysia crispata]